MEAQKKTLEYRGYLKGHNDHVTCLEVGEHKVSEDQTETFLVSGSRDKSIMIWELDLNGTDDECGRPKRCLKGHNHLIQDIALSQDSRYCVSASWDNTLRLWDLQKGTTTRRFVGHTKDVLSVTFSADNRQIISGGRDKSLRIWNTIGECKYASDAGVHTDWVSCVRYSPDPKVKLLVTASWDKTIKVWDPDSMTLRHTFVGHSNIINSIAVPPRGFYLASGGADGKAMLWNVQKGQHMKTYDGNPPINTVVFATTDYWLTLGTDKGIRVWDLPQNYLVADIKATPIGEEENTKKGKKTPACLSLAWSKTGTHLFAGFSDNIIRVYEVVKVQNA